MSDATTPSEEVVTWTPKLPPWNPHMILHAKGDPATCAECAINAANRKRYEDAVTFYGGSFDLIPVEELGRLAVQNQTDWIEFYAGNRPGGGTVVKHDKTARLTAFIDGHEGEEFTAQQLADEVESSVSTVWEFIRLYRWRFTKVATGTYRVVDAAAARAADEALAASIASAPTIAQDGSESSGPTAAPNPVALIAPPTYGPAAKL